MSFFSKGLDYLLNTTATPREVAPLSTAGVTGTVSYGGMIVSNEKNSKLTGTQKYVTYSQILANTSIVAAGVRYFLNLLSKAEWKAEPADDSDEAKKYAEFLESVLHDMETSWTRVVKRTAMYRFYGFGVQEWTAKVRKDGKIGFKDVEARPQATIELWDITETGTVKGVVQRSPQTNKEIYLPRTKIVYVVEDSLNDSPEGLGLFRHLVDAAGRLSRYEVLEGFGFEADLRGVPVGRAPIAAMAAAVEAGTITAAQKLAMEAPIKDFITNHIKNPKLGLFLDSAPYASLDEAGTPSTVKQWDMELLNVNSSSQEAVAAAINRLNNEIARVLNVEGLLLGANSEGSHALSRDKSAALHLVVDSTLSEIREAYQRDLVRTLWALNGLPEELIPKLRTGAIQFHDVQQITQALRDMAASGAVLAINDPGINEVRSLMGLSPAPYQTEETSVLQGRMSLRVRGNDPDKAFGNDKEEE